MSWATIFCIPTFKLREPFEERRRWGLGSVTSTCHGTKGQQIKQVTSQSAYYENLTFTKFFKVLSNNK